MIHVPALVILVKYHLTLEHHLQVAYKDAVEAITWLRNQAEDINGFDEWLRNHANYSHYFLMGSSANGNGDS